MRAAATAARRASGFSEQRLRGTHRRERQAGIAHIEKEHQCGKVGRRWKPRVPDASAGRPSSHALPIPEEAAGAGGGESASGASRKASALAGGAGLPEAGSVPAEPELLEAGHTHELWWRSGF